MTQQPTTAGTEPTLAEVLVGDPLSEVTRKTRLYLLAVSLIGVAMVRTGLVPTKIATFGIELEQPNRSALLFLIALVNLYFLAAFVLYAVSDYRKWRGQFEAARESNVRALRFRLVGYLLGMSEDAIMRRYYSGEYEEDLWNEPYPNFLSAQNGERHFTLAERKLLQGKSPLWVIERASRGQLFELLSVAAVSAPSISVQMRANLRGHRTDRTTGFLRGFFEFVLPILVGLFGIGALLFRSFSV
jgi:hypothetical protein